MPILVALWLALVHALALTPSLRLPAAAGAFATVAHADPRETTRTRPADRRPDDEALRQAQPARSVSVARGATPLLSGPPVAALVATPRLPDGALIAAAVRARALELSHAVSARGDVLPYFPTAPPLQG